MEDFMDNNQIKFVESNIIVKLNQVKFLLNYVLSEKEELFAIFEGIKSRRSINPAHGFIEESDILILTDKKIVNIMLKENEEIIKTIPFCLVMGTKIERVDTSCNNEEQYKSIDRIKNIEIDLKDSQSVIFNISEGNEHYDKKILKEKAIEFIKKLNQII